MNVRSPWVICLLVAGALGVWAQGGPDPVGMLGWDLARAFEELGVPERVEAVRGGEAWQDDVAFVYGEGLVLFFWRERVWQVFVGEGYGDGVAGIEVGMVWEEVAASVEGRLLQEEGEIAVFELPDRGFPVRMQVLRKEGRIEGVYVYRADF